MDTCAGGPEGTVLSAGQYKHCCLSFTGKVALTADTEAMMELHRQIPTTYHQTLSNSRLEEMDQVLRDNVNIETNGQKGC